MTSALKAMVWDARKTGSGGERGQGRCQERTECARDEDSKPTFDLRTRPKGRSVSLGDAKGERMGSSTHEFLESSVIQRFSRLDERRSTWNPDEGESARALVRSSRAAKTHH